MTRDEAAARRRGIPPERRRALSDAIRAHVLSWDAFREAKTVMAYASVGAEVETAGLLDAIVRQGKRLALPRCLGAGVMEAVLVDGPHALTRGTLGIPEPVRALAALDRREIDLILAPGLLFDRYGNRLGRGAGYYDRYLEGFGGMTCGLAFSAQVIELLETKPHDAPVRALATEHGIRVIEGRQTNGEEAGR